MMLSINGSLRAAFPALLTFLVIGLLCACSASAQNSSRRSYVSEKPRSILVTPRVAKNLQPNRKPFQQGQQYRPEDFGIRPIQQIQVDTQSKYPDSVPENHAARLLAKEKKIEYLSDPIHYEFVQANKTAADFAHQPLYFEELNLERHGTKLRCLQPAVSGARFVASATLLPYKMTRQPPRHHVHNCDPNPSGLPATWVRERGKVSPKGIAAELAAFASVMLIIP